MSTTIEVEVLPRDLKARVVREAIKATDAPYLLATVASHHDLTLDEVKAIVQAHGWPRPDSMLRAAGILERQQPTPVAKPAPSRPDVDAERAATAALAEADATMPDAAPKAQRSLKDMLADGKLHPSKRIRAAAEKVTTSINNLRRLLDEDQGQAEARAEVARLQAELAAAKAKLKTGTKAAPSRPTETPTGDYACEHADCDRSFPTKQGLSMHGRRAHGGDA